MGSGESISMAATLASFNVARIFVTFSSFLINELLGMLANHSRYGLFQEDSRATEPHRDANLLPLLNTRGCFYTLNANTKVRARPTTELSAVMLMPVAEAAFLPEPPVVELELLPPVLLPDVDPFTSCVTAKKETPASVVHSELFRGAADARKVISAHYFMCCQRLICIAWMRTRLTL